MTTVVKPAKGYACLALSNPKTPENVGAVLRAAHAFGCASVAIGGVRGGRTYGRWCRNGLNTSKAERHVPVFLVAEPLAYSPLGAKRIAVEFSNDAYSLPEFLHPSAATYVFGPEDGSVNKDDLARCDAVVRIPTRLCLNLAAAVNVVLYDRLAKGLSFAADAETQIGRLRANEIRVSSYRRVAS